MNYPKTIILAVLATASAFAADGTYTANANRDWTNTTAWENGTIASGAGAVATISRAAWAGSRSVSLSTNITVGSVYFSGSPTTPLASASATIRPGTTAGILTLDNNGTVSTISNTGWGAATINNEISLANDLNVINYPSTTSGTEVSTFLTLNGTVSSNNGTLRTITTLPSPLKPAGANSYRIVISGVVKGNVAIRHNSGNNLNIQTVAQEYYGGLYIKSGNANSSGIGVGALGASNNVITFEARDNVTDNVGVLSFSGFITNSSMLVATQAVHLESDGRIAVGLAAATDTQSGGITTLTWAGQISGTGALYKLGASELILTAQNSYTGNTIVSAGTLSVGTNNAINAASQLVLSSSTTFNANGFSQAFSGLDIDGNAAITLGDTGTNTLAFDDSSGFNWGSYTLTITGDFTDGQSVRFGTNANGLTADQLAKITINGEQAYLWSNGYLATTIPEPAVAALLTGALALALAVRRRR